MSKEEIIEKLKNENTLLRVQISAREEVCNELCNKINKAVKCYLEKLAILNADDLLMDETAVKMFNYLEGNTK